MMKIIAMKRFGDRSIETFRIYAMFTKVATAVAIDTPDYELNSR